MVKEAAEILRAIAAAGFGITLGFAVKDYLEHKKRGSNARQDQETPR